MNPAFAQLQQLKDSGELNIVNIISKMTPEELDAKGESGNTVLFPKVDWTQELDSIPDKGGWRIKYIGTSQEGAVGKIIIFPNSQWANAIWLRGQERFISRFGLTEEQKQVWLKSTYRQRHDVQALQLLKLVITTPHLLFLYLNFDTEWDAEQGKRWDAHNNICHQLTHSSRRGLSILTKMIYRVKCIDPDTMIAFNHYRNELRKKNGVRGNKG
jgi:hypothetical protein